MGYTTNVVFMYMGCEAYGIGNVMNMIFYLSACQSYYFQKR